MKRWRGRGGRGRGEQGRGAEDTQRKTEGGGEEEPRHGAILQGLAVVCCAIQTTGTQTKRVWLSCGTLVRSANAADKPWRWDDGWGLGARAQHGCFCGGGRRRILRPASTRY